MGNRTCTIQRLQLIKLLIQERLKCKTIQESLLFSRLRSQMISGKRNPSGSAWGLLGEKEVSIGFNSRKREGEREGRRKRKWERKKERKRWKMKEKFPGRLPIVTGVCRTMGQYNGGWQPGTLLPSQALSGMNRTPRGKDTKPILIGDYK